LCARPDTDIVVLVAMTWTREIAVRHATSSSKQEVTMAVSPETARVGEMYQQMVSGSDGSIESFRAGYSAMFSNFKAPEDALIDHVEIGGVRCLQVSAPGVRQDKVLLLVHGGGYCLGSAEDYDEFGFRLSAAADCRVIVSDYRLAPENPFPAALEDNLAVYRALSAQSTTSSIAILGESAGGGVALSVAVSLRDKPASMDPVGLVLISPLIDLAAEGASLNERAHLDPLPIEVMVKGMGGAYLAGKDPKATPLASPLYAELSGLPPLLVMVGECEGLYDDAARLTAKVQAASGEVAFEVGEGQFHIWPVFDFLPEAQAASSRIGEFLRLHLATASAV
jgi:epsilon-lactone hydrolase